MLYYFVPDSSIFGGIKVAYQFVDALNDLGVQSVIASPKGEAATWFSSSAPVIDAKLAKERIGSGDRALFSLPHDYESILKLPATPVFHCQGTDPLIDPILEDSSIQTLTCWKQATEYVSGIASREPIQVGISIADEFFYCGEPKLERAVAYMPRRGGEIYSDIIESCPEFEFVPIDGVGEWEAARIMKACSYYLATAEGEWFGLPALEAMAAGCVVLSVPVLGGMEYLSSEKNCRVSDAEHYREAFRELTSEGAAEKRFFMRQSAVETAHGYTSARLRENLGELLSGPLSEWRAQ